MNHRGPKNPDDYRVDYYRSRHYWDPLPACELRPDGPFPTDKDGEPIKKGNALPAQSTIMKAIPSDALLYWAVGKTAEYAVDEREKWEKLDRGDAVELLKKAHRKASGQAADRGSSIHEYLEAKLAGEDFDVFHLHEDALPYVPVVDRFIADQRPELILSEVVGIGDRHGVTTDAILRLPELGDGLNVIDWKTRNDTVKKPHVVYEKEVAQLGANLDLRYWIVEDVETGAPSRLAVPEGMGAVLVTFTTTAYAIHWVDAEQAVAGFRDVLSWWSAMKRLPKATSKPTIVEVPAPVPVPTVEPSSGEETGSGTTTDPDPVSKIDDETSPEQVPDRAQIRTRIEKLLEAGHETELVTRWPDGIPGLSEAADGELRQIEKAVDRTEAEVGAPFDPPPSDPVPPRTVNRAPVDDPKPDEGPDVETEDVETVRKAWSLLEADGAKWVEELAGKAGNLSMTERPSARRARIGWSVVRLGVAGWHDDEVLEAVLDHANALKFRGDIGRSLAALDWHDAGRLSTTVGELIEERYVFVVDPDGGWLRLQAA